MGNILLFAKMSKLAVGTRESPSGYQICFPDIKQLGCEVDHITSIWCQGWGWVELYVFLLCMPSWHGQGQLYF
jgi:hypothetical protein